jgi:hypothetical protein
VEVLLGAVLVLVASGGAGMLVRPAQKPDQILRARFGDVVWNHDLHARLPEIATCTVCHHTERQGTTRPKPCGDCHTLFSNEEAVVMADLFMEQEQKTYSGEQGPPAMEVFHNKCMGCHKAMKQGPTGCRDCHAQAFSGTQGIVEWDHRTHARKMDMDCVKCHHQDRSATWDGEYRGCGGCHQPAAFKGMEFATGLAEHEDARHGQCYTCHTQYNPENDLRSCTDCHPGLIPLSDDERPSIEEAVHVRCMECHNLAYQELKPSMPIYCTDCHKPDPSLILDEEMGPVLFSHKRHGEYGGMTCDRCHHTDVPGEPHVACDQCHGAGHLAHIPDLKDALFACCLDCHQEEGVGLCEWEDFKSTGADLQFFPLEGKEGNFYWDHRFHAVGLSLSCRDCHHNIIQKDGVYVTASRTGKAWPKEAGRIQTCRNCHGDDGPVLGSVAEGTGAKDLEAAYQRLCIACHERLGGGPITWEAFFESPQEIRPEKDTVK